MTRVTKSTGRCAVWAECSIVRHTDWSSVSIAAGAAWLGAAASAHSTANIAAHHAGISLSCILEGALPGREHESAADDPTSRAPLLSRPHRAVLVFCQFLQYAIRHRGG